MNDRDGTADWLLSTQGRIARIVFGSLLIVLGLGIIGAIPIASAAYGRLLIGPLFGRDLRGRRPEQQPDEEDDGEGESEDEPRDEDRSGDDESRDDAGENEPDEEWSAPPLARAERPEGQGPRTKDLRSEEPAGSADEPQG